MDKYFVPFMYGSWAGEIDQGLSVDKMNLFSYTVSDLVPTLRGGVCEFG